MVEVTYSIRVRRGEDGPDIFATEAELAAGVHPLSALVAGDGYGQMVLQAPGQPAFVPEDTLEALVRALCFDAVLDLVDRDAARVTYYSSGGFFDLKRQDASIDVVPDRDAPATRYMAAELLPALVACGERYVAQLKAAHGARAELGAYYEELDADVADAREAIGAGD